MSNVPKVYFEDISAEEMREVMGGVLQALPDVSLADAEIDAAWARAHCESRNHREHRGDLWQCVQCLRFYCWEEEYADADTKLCDDCWDRPRARRLVPALV